MNDFQYVGQELDLFAKARNWKRYWSAAVRPFIRGDVLEVGAGMGSNTPYLDTGKRGRWLCLEPDPALVRQMKANQPAYDAVCGTVAGLPPDQRFDTLIYIDVLEHIENDRQELAAAAARLRPGGRLIVLSPAHQRLFTPFDAAIGHFRRYSRRMLRDISPPNLVVERLIYLDAVGLLASGANLLFLRQSMPKAGQLRLWDEWMIPVSRLIDPLLFHSAGKTIIGVWRNPL